jgi:hypothetical protein
MRRADCFHQEAGGYSAHFDGNAYLPIYFTGGLICGAGQSKLDVGPNGALRYESDRLIAIGS